MNSLETTCRGANTSTIETRLWEQFGYAYDKAWNLSQRTNKALVQTFNLNSENELTSASRSGTLTVAGSTREGNPNHPALSQGVMSVTVSGQQAATYFDGTFAAAGFTPANGNNTFTAIAQDTYGRVSGSSVAPNLPASASYSYDLNGNIQESGRGLVAQPPALGQTSALQPRQPLGDAEVLASSQRQKRVRR